MTGVDRRTAMKAVGWTAAAFLIPGSLSSCASETEIKAEATDLTMGIELFKREIEQNGNIEKVLQLIKNQELFRDLGNTLGSLYMASGSDVMQTTIADLYNQLFSHADYLLGTKDGNRYPGMHVPLFWQEMCDKIPMASPESEQAFSSLANRLAQYAAVFGKGIDPRSAAWLSDKHQIRNQTNFAKLYEWERWQLTRDISLYLGRVSRLGYAADQAGRIIDSYTVNATNAVNFLHLDQQGFSIEEIRIAATTSIPFIN